MFSKTSIKYLFLAAFIFFLNPNITEAVYTIDVPYQQAVPDFLEAITEETANVKDETELQAIADWETDARVQLPTFLLHLITIAQQLEANGDAEFVFDRYQKFADKWNMLADDYPGLNELEPVLTPIIDELLAGLPELEAADSTRNPISNLYDLYIAMVEVNPWFVYTLWDIPVIPNAQKISTVSEITHEVTVEGYKTVDVIDRDIFVTLNGMTVFSESIEDNAVVDRMVVLRDPSVIHETLNAMIEGGATDRDIGVIQEWVDLVNLHLQTSLDLGIIDDCSYSFIFRSQLAGKSTCVDRNGNVQDFQAISKYDPFDDLNQVELTRVDPLANVDFGAFGEVFAQVLNPVIAPFVNDDSAAELLAPEGEVPPVPEAPSAPTAITPATPAPRVPDLPLRTWVLGLLTPAYLWSAAGYMRMF